jgi:23S rRNA pseudouridine1911/1915/1917 synthase
VFVDRKRVKVASRKVRAGQTIEVHLGGAFQRASKQLGAAARERDQLTLPSFGILFEDEHLVAVNKPARLLTAPTPEGDRGNLLHLLQQTRPNVQVVHRLDLQTSGVLVFAKSDEANRALGETFRRHDLVRRYSVFVFGHYPLQTETLSTAIRGQHAVTHVERAAQFGDFTWVKATLETGRTHQIRIHLAARGYPVLADPRYGVTTPRIRPPRLALHAEKLAFQHPVTGQALTFELELPPDLADWLTPLREQAAEGNTPGQKTEKA